MYHERDLDDEGHVCLERCNYQNQELDVFQRRLNRKELDTAKLVVDNMKYEQKSTLDF